MRLVCSVGPLLGNLSLYWLQTCSAFVKIATQSFIYKKKKKMFFSMKQSSREKSGQTPSL